MTTSPRKVFVSYSHRQGDWVWDRLVPVLRAGGAEILIDRERFEAGRALSSQMDATQDAADVNVLVLSPDYLTSGACRHEMERAIARDSRFENGVVVPVKRVEVELPEAVRQPDPLLVDLRNDGAAQPWDLLLRACGADLGTDAPAWLDARDEIRRFLVRGQSVNIVTDYSIKYKELISAVKRLVPDLAHINLERPATASRRGLVSEILQALGIPVQVPPEPEDLVALDRALVGRPRSSLALTNFDLAAHRPTYGIDLFAALRYLMVESRQLVLLVHSFRPFGLLVPIEYLSSIDLHTVELRTRR